ncbi:hypothetical protein K5Y32_08200 [Pantoea sp. DY-15]|uniref:putative T6SS immunity periplasmic lipoprotein n=1 Tax=unclassified Pantoea TaxID=2630326 RepID=UPI001C97952E|nr:MULTISPECIES: putative T6SS immunity periplasmic lipoprotein [unclassified Pantoea]MBY4836658.1 hypothetical protein [Pantoea sp. DY-5]MBY4887915.1 hypothetical protein [Pantoea sp. DY-15]
MVISQLNKIKSLSCIIACFTLTGCIGDKVTFSEVAQAVQKEKDICFEVERVSEYRLKSMSIFRRGMEDDRESVNFRDSHIIDGQYICIPRALSDKLSDGEYIVRFSLKSEGLFQSVRVFSNAIQLKEHEVKSIPLQQDETTHYLGNRF